ncbi:FG-GAP-like repeat-containing protein [Micromonospora sp. IBSANI012]|uniref:FG-GAP-like repeat-containing protein n=1 Tax=Micromonospora sp. IBSANI012 TaxID=3457761 RepID=UPI0040584BA0
MRLPLKRQLIAVLAFLVTATGTVVAGASPAAAAPVTPIFSQDIEDYADYDGQDTCDPTAKPGVVDFMNLLNSTYGVHATLENIGRACGGATSEHKEGRALDYILDVNNTTQRGYANDILNWIQATDQYGNRHALMRRLGIMYMIWNKQIISSHRISEGWRPYSCDGTPGDCHTNHIHFSFSWPGARMETSWWTNRLASGGSISDVSGDGYADILATKPDSTLHYYSNNINSNPDNLPYISSRQIGSGWNTFNRVMSGDVSGDGYADVIATKPDGTLWYYPNNINSNPDNKPYNTGREIGGPGWNTYNRVLLGDVNGDGYADIIATKPDGTLHYYSNNIKSNPDNLPYIGSREIGGPGWNAYNRVMIGDVSGDGYADLLATKPDGTLHYYSNNINSNPDNLPYISSREIGGPGWNAYNRVMAGDVSGDGYADLLATKPDGTLHYYSNNIKSNPNNLPYIGSREIGGPGWNSYNRVF